MIGERRTSLGPYCACTISNGGAEKHLIIMGKKVLAVMWVEWKEKQLEPGDCLE